MKISALPHLTARSVTASPWTVSFGSQFEPLVPVLKGWDYQTPIALQSVVHLQREKILIETGLSEYSRLAIVATWRASSTNIRRRGRLVEVEDSTEYQIELEVPAGEAGGTLTLKRQLVLLESVGAAHPLAATTAGSILWTERRENEADVILEGDGSRFPTEIIDFRTSSISDQDAIWWLDVDLGDLQTAPANSIRLYLNAGHPVVMKMTDRSSGAESERLEEILQWDVTRQMMEYALENEEFVSAWGTYRAGSVGEALETLLRKYWPGEDATSLAALRSQSPGVFEAKLQGRMQLLGGKGD